MYKPFDITKHNWSDTDPAIEVCEHMHSSEVINLSFKADGLIDSDHTYININKDDAIAIAKHFDKPFVLTKSDFLCRDEMYDDFYKCKCGNQTIVESDKYCSGCGNSLEWDL